MSTSRRPTWTIDGERLHYLHVTSSHAGAIPLLLTHGWPGSVVEFLRGIPALVDLPDPADAFTVVCPSIPGYAWSGPTRQRGWDIRRVARALARLMTDLGYERYGAQGGDRGAIATAHLSEVDAFFRDLRRPIPSTWCCR